MVQEYGRYFGMPTCCLRGGCLTGPNHSRRRAARLPELPREVQPRRPASTASSATRASRSATTSTRSTSPRFIARVRRRAAAGRGLQPRRRQATTAARSSRRSTASSELTGKPMQYGVRRPEPRPATTSATSAICEDAGALSRVGHHQVARRHLQGDRQRLADADEVGHEMPSSLMNSSLLLGTHIHPATGDAARRQVRAMTCLREICPTTPVNLQFADRVKRAGVRRV